MAASNTTMTSCHRPTNFTMIEPALHSDTWYAVGWINNTFPSLQTCCQSTEVSLFDNIHENMTAYPGCFSYCNITKDGLTSDSVAKCMSDKLDLLGIDEAAAMYGNKTKDEPTSTSTPTATASKPPTTSAPGSGAERVKGTGAMGYAVFGLAFSSAFLGLL